MLPTAAERSLPTATSTDNFSSDAICAIISACADGKVSRFTYGDIMIEFPTHTQSFSNIESLPNLSYEFSAPQASEQPKESGKDFDRELLEDLKASQQMIDDPYGFEREIIESHLRGEAK